MRFLGLSAVVLAGCGSHVEPASTPESCAGCHDAEVQSWTGSPHATVRTDPVFAHSWAERREPWCLECHVEGGVDCATCHGAEARSCGDCHDFELPVSLGETPEFRASARGQATVREWEQSAAAAMRTGCTDCHDPHGDGSDRIRRLRTATSVDTVRSGDEVHATVRVANLGHAFPTGDPFRRLQLTLCDDLACARPSAVVELQRRLERGPDERWVVATDTRIPPPADGLNGHRTFVLHAPAARSWQLTMHLTDPRHAPALGDRAAFVVATGRVEN